MAKSTFIRESPCKGGRNEILVAAGCKVGAAWLWWTHPAADKKLLSLSSANILFILNRTVSSASGGIRLGDSSLGIGRPVNTYTEEMRAQVKSNKLERNHFLQTKNRSYAS